MIRTGSKFFIGLAALNAATLIAYLLFVERLALGGVALSIVFAAVCGLSTVVLIVRDGDDEAQPVDAALVGASMWPLVTVLGVVLLAVGLVTTSAVFVIGIVVVLAALAEWAVQAWSESASDDPAHNAATRKRIANPIEFPVLATLGVGVVIFSFSRIMLAVSKSTGAVLFIVFGTIVLVGGSLFALRPGLKRSIVAGLCTLATLGIVAGGVASAGIGLRADLVEAATEGHYTHRECGPERSKYFDKLEMRTLSLRSNVIATVELRDGKLTARAYGIQSPTQSITIPRSNPVNVIFRNFDAGEYRLVASPGKAVPDATEKPEELCTQLIPEGAEQSLTLTYAKPSIDRGPYSLFVAGLSGQSIEVVVP
jgi:hypothetical protein